MYGGWAKKKTHLCVGGIVWDIPENELSTRYAGG